MQLLSWLSVVLGIVSLAIQLYDRRRCRQHLMSRVPFLILLVLCLHLICIVSI
jgi:hypothetical protein